MIGLAGVLLGAVGWLDVLMLWFPAHFGRAEWEFGTASTTFDALPVATLGTALMLASTMALGWRVRQKVLASFSFAVVALLLGALVLWSLAVPLAWRGVAPTMLPALKRAMVKTVILAFAYLVTYGWFGWKAWRGAAVQPPRG